MKKFDILFLMCFTDDRRFYKLDLIDKDGAMLGVCTEYKQHNHYSKNIRICQITP